MNLKDFRPKFTELKFVNKINQYAKSIGTKAIYSSLLLFYAYKHKDTPLWAKNIVIGTLGYLISPIDFIPDLTPIFGYTDDIGVLSFGLVTIACYIDDSVKEEARGKLNKWFKSVSQNDIDSVEETINV